MRLYWLAKHRKSVAVSPAETKDVACLKQILRDRYLDGNTLTYLIAMYILRFMYGYSYG